MRILIPVKNPEAITRSIKLWNHGGVKAGDFPAGVFDQESFQGTGSDFIPIGGVGQNVIR